MKHWYWQCKSLLLYTDSGILISNDIWPNLPNLKARVRTIFTQLSYLWPFFTQIWSIIFLSHWNVNMASPKVLWHIMPTTFWALMGHAHFIELLSKNGVGSLSTPTIRKTFECEKICEISHGYIIIYTHDAQCSWYISWNPFKFI